MKKINVYESIVCVWVHHLDPWQIYNLLNDLPKAYYDFLGYDKL